MAYRRGGIARRVDLVSLRATLDGAKRSHINVDLAVHILRTNKRPDTEYSFCGSVMTWDTARAVAERMNLFCRYSSPNDYYTFDTFPFPERKYHKVVR
jgi:hypothetical protein